MPKLAIGHVEHSSVIDLRPVSIVRQEDKFRVSIDEFLDEPRQATRSTLIFSRVIHFMN
jgi:hypothetical protein